MVTAFGDFPPDVCRPLQVSDGVELLGAPIFGSDQYYEDFTAALFNKVKNLQDLLPDLEDPQVELQLLRHCLSCCKVIHVLRTVPPHKLHNLSLFDDQLRNSLSRVVRTSLSDISWQQATLPLRLGGLGIRQASDICYAAYLGSCSANRDLVCQLLGLDFDTGFVLVGEVLAQQSFSQQVTSSVDFLSISQTLLQSTLDDHIYSNILSRCSIRDRARLLAISDPSGLSCAWLQVLPAPQLGLAIPPAEFVVALRLWLGIPVFSRADSFSCSCHQLVDRFGDHLIGCGHGPLRVRRHNALCDIIYYALLEDNSEVRREQGVSGESSSRPGDVFHPDFHNGHPTYFDISVRSSVHSGVITHSAVSPGFAALRGEMEKDARHRGLVEAAGGVFFPLVVDNFGVWTPSSIEVLRSVARTSTVRNGLSVSTSFRHLVERLCVQLYRYNAKMILHFWSLHPHLEDDWLEACSGLNDASHDDDVDIFDDSDGVDTVACPVTSSSSLVSPSADATDHRFYAVDVCNRFSSLSVENIPAMESSQASNSTSIIATSGNAANDMSSSSSSTSLNTSSTTMDTLPDFINWPEDENQKMSSRAAKRQRRTQCKQVYSQTMVKVESDSSNRQHDSSSTTIQEENKKCKLTKKPRQLSDNTAAENQQQKEDIELDSSNDKVEKGRSQGGSGLSSDDLHLTAEMMHCSSNQKFKLATSGNKFDKQKERSQGGKQIINDVQFNSSSSPTNHGSSGAAENQSLIQTAFRQDMQHPQQPAMQRSRPSNPSPTTEPNDQYAIMASLKQQQPPPPSQQQAKDTDRIDASQKFYSGDYNTILQVAKDKEIMGGDNREDDVFIPKDNTIFLEDSEMNEIDRELEEFKRFCLMVKPLKNRPKVAVQVDLKDLAFK